MKNFPIDAFTSVSLIALIATSMMILLGIARNVQKFDRVLLKASATLAALALPATISKIYSVYVVAPIYLRHWEYVVEKPLKAMFLLNFVRVAFVMSVLSTIVWLVIVVERRARGEARDPS